MKEKNTTFPEDYLKLTLAINPLPTNGTSFQTRAIPATYFINTCSITLVTTIVSMETH
jgi:hypothetical protein